MRLAILLLQASATACFIGSYASEIGWLWWAGWPLLLGSIPLMIAADRARASRMTQTLSEVAK